MAVQMSHASQEAFAALMEGLLSNPVMLNYSQGVQDPVPAAADLQAAVAELAAALQEAGIAVPPGVVVAEAPLMPLEPLDDIPDLEAADADHPLNNAFMEQPANNAEAEEEAEDGDQTIHCDLSTVYQDDDADELYEEAMAGHGLPGVLVNVVHDAWPLLAVVRAQDDLPNLIKNGFYFDLRAAIYRLMGSRNIVPLWRSGTDQALANLLPHLAADTHGLVVDLMEQFEQTMGAAENWMLQNLLPDNTLPDYPLVHPYYVFYVRRQLRHPPIEEAADYVDPYFGDAEDNAVDDAEAAVPLLAPHEQQPA
jgi:hypothetical protein